MSDSTLLKNDEEQEIIPPMMKTDMRVVSYYTKNHMHQIMEYGNEICSTKMSNTIRSIVVRFLQNHFAKNKKVE